jgi:hypothetical protein
MTTLTFCILSMCQPLTSWQFVFEDSPPHWVHVIANGTDYGRCAMCSFDVPVSHVLPDEQVRKDAERYRWLVENAEIQTTQFIHYGRDPASTKQPLDIAIDAAIASDVQGGKEGK